MYQQNSCKERILPETKLDFRLRQSKQVGYGKGRIILLILYSKYIEKSVMDYLSRLFVLVDGVICQFGVGELDGVLGTVGEELDVTGSGGNVPCVVVHVLEEERG